jgi:hypothetical protein
VQHLLLVAVLDCAKILQNLFPEDAIKSLSGESPEGIAKFKTLVIDRVNERVDLIGMSEQQERAFVESLVDI